MKVKVSIAPNREKRGRWTILLCEGDSLIMDSKLKELVEIADIDLSDESPHLTLLDDFCHCLLDKENASQFPEDFGEIELSDAEIVIAHAWNAWGLALNGGATEAVSCTVPDEVADAFVKLGASDIAEALLELDGKLQTFEMEIKSLSQDDKDSAFSNLKWGEWKDLNSVLYSPDERVPQLVYDYICANVHTISISGFERQPKSINA